MASLMFVFCDPVVVVSAQTSIGERLYLAFKSDVEMRGSPVDFQGAATGRMTEADPFAVPCTGKSIFSEGFAEGNRPPIHDRD